MENKTWLRLPALLLLLALLLTGCMDANEEYIQGVWQYDSIHLRQMTSESELIVEWSFSGGVFEYSACCFNIDDYQTGRYRIVDSDEDSLTLDLFNVEGGELAVDRQITIKIDRENETLSINHAKPFIRIFP